MDTPTQQVIWTPLPNGIDGDGAHVSVVVSPRLSTGRRASLPLKMFPVWLDWPAVVQKAQFVLSLGGQKMRAKLVSAPDSKVWQAIFRSGTIVEGYPVEDLTGRCLISYPMAAMAQRLRDAYTAAAGTYVQGLPVGTEVQPLLADFARAPSGPDTLKRLAAPDGDGYLKEIGSTGLADLAEFHAYHAPFDISPGSEPTRDDARALIDGMDFHRLVSSLGEHSLLLRQTGLVLDLVAEAPPRTEGDALTVAVEWHQGRDVETLPDVQPRVMCRADKERFETVARSARITGRRLDLSLPSFAPYQVDLDGGIIKLTGTGKSMVSRDANEAETLKTRHGGTLPSGGVPKDTEPTGLPTLRSTGIVLAEGGRADTLADGLARSADFETALENGKPITLSTEEVTRGLLVDVLANDIWYSLCRMSVTYALADGKMQLQDKHTEGLIQLAVGEAPPGASAELANIMRFSEALCHWDGWSLTAPKPGTPLDNDGVPTPGEDDGLPVQVHARAFPRSLPALRFGATYRMRVRLADLAHNAESWEAKDDAGASGEITYRRFEPVAPPAPALVRTGGKVDAPEDGASLLRLVIRSDADQLDRPSPDEDLRLLFPPRTSVEMAERHGVLDDKNGRVGAEHYDLLTGRDADLDPIQAGAPPEQRTYPVGDAGALAAPWLPDPMAQHQRVNLTPDRPRRFEVGGTVYPPDTYRQIDPGADWPNQRPWTLRLFEDPADALRFVPTHDTGFTLDTRVSWDETARVLSVALPKGETATVELSHMFEGKPDPADLWGLAAWLKETLNVDVYDGVRNAINAGRHWTFTPELKLELVHAVQRPLVRPDPNIRPVVRARGETDVPLTVTAPCHAESTESLSLRGRWVEARDTGQGAPGAGWQGGEALRRALRDDDSPAGQIELEGRHAFGDTRYRRIRYALTGASRFSEYFPPAVRDDPAAVSVTSPDVIVHMPNAAPPAPPSVVRSIPVFDWLRHPEGGTKASWRRSGVRVFLRRPWFTTGFGEMLAAVLARPGATTGAAFERAAPNLSLWAGDPIWKTWGSGSTITDVSPSLDVFPARARPTDGPDARWPDYFPVAERELASGGPRYDNLSLPDEDGNEIVRVDAAAHPVSWDPDAELYHADLIIDPGAVYQPFLRLAVARMHPISVTGCHLSPAVTLDMIQALPDRLAVARNQGGSGWRVELYGYLHGERDGAHDADRPYQSVVRAEVQRTGRTDPDELDWETVDEAALADAPSATPITQNVAFAMPSSYTGPSLFPGKSGALFDAASTFIDRRPEPLFSRTMRTPGAGGGSRGGDRWRIRLTEWERHSADQTPQTLRQQPGANERLVFAETFEV